MLNELFSHKTPSWNPPIICEELPSFRFWIWILVFIMNSNLNVSIFTINSPSQNVGVASQHQKRLYWCKFSFACDTVVVEVIQSMRLRWHLNCHIKNLGSYCEVFPNLHLSNPNQALLLQSVSINICAISFHMWSSFVTDQRYCLELINKPTNTLQFVDKARWDLGIAYTFWPSKATLQQSTSKPIITSLMFLKNQQFNH